MVNASLRHVTLSGLEKFTSYEMIVMSVTSRGTGIASLSAYNKTLEDGKCFFCDCVVFVFGFQSSTYVQENMR